MFQRCRDYLKILGVTWVGWTKFHTVDTLLLGTTVQDAVTWDLWTPGLSNIKEYKFSFVLHWFFFKTTSTALYTQFCASEKIITRKGACVFMCWHINMYVCVCVCVSCMRKTIKVYWDLKQEDLRALDSWLHICKLRHTLGYKTLSCENGSTMMIVSINTFLPTHAWFWNMTHF